MIVPKIMPDLVPKNYHHHYYCHVIAHGDEEVGMILSSRVAISAF